MHRAAALLVPSRSADCRAFQERCWWQARKGASIEAGASTSGSQAGVSAGASPLVIRDACPPEVHVVSIHGIDEAMPSKPSLAFRPRNAATTPPNRHPCPEEEVLPMCRNAQTLQARSCYPPPFTIR
jgi:hypothetical protein